MNVLYTLTKNLYPYLRWSIESLLEHNKNVKLFILAEDDELPFEIPCKHEIINVSGQKYFGPDCVNAKSQFTYMAMIRVCLSEILKVNKVISLDVDTVICDSIEPIWDIDLKGKWIAWCPEHRGSFKPYGPRYYNLGVSVMNLQQLRKDGFTEKAVKMLNEEFLPYIDQDVFNKLAVPDKTVDIDVRYNESFCCGETQNPAIVHYAGFRDWYYNGTIPRISYLNKYKYKEV